MDRTLHTHGQTHLEIHAPTQHAQHRTSRIVRGTKCVTVVRLHDHRNTFEIHNHGARINVHSIAPM
jgi:hypothetical protein